MPIYFLIKQVQVSPEMFVLMSSAVMSPLKWASYIRKPMTFYLKPWNVEFQHFYLNFLEYKVKYSSLEMSGPLTGDWAQVFCVSF